MSNLFAKKALLPNGWAENVLIEISPKGEISAVLSGHGSNEAALTKDILIPGLPNLHSHAFQRAMAGRAEFSTRPQESFWTWRETMYGLVEGLAPRDVKAIATQLYIEMLKAGFTSVAEFHYFHFADPKSSDPLPMSAAISAAATEAGIGLTLLPVLYEVSGFGADAPSPAQEHFAMSVPRYFDMWDQLQEEFEGDENKRLGLAFHSLRAVPESSIAASLRLLEGRDGFAPIHIHIAEQTQEVEDCIDFYGKRPVEWLSENVALDRRWCLVHATHMSEEETDRVAASGAVAGLCPITEANLGDGLFPFDLYLHEGGNFGVGSDSHVEIDGPGELRLLEYGQRLKSQRRLVGTTKSQAHTGAALYTGALDGGAKACGRAIGRIEVGARADFLSLDAAHPQLAARDNDFILDSLVFSGGKGLIKDVMVGGNWVIEDGRHVLEKIAATEFCNVLERQRSAKPQ